MYWYNRHVQVYCCTSAIAQRGRDLTRFLPHTFIEFYMEVLILGVILQYMVSASLSCFL